MVLYGVLDIREHSPTEDIFYKGQNPQGNQASGSTHRLHQQMVPDCYGQGEITRVPSAKNELIPLRGDFLEASIDVGQMPVTSQTLLRVPQQDSRPPRAGRGLMPALLRGTGEQQVIPANSTGLLLWRPTCPSPVSCLFPKRADMS